jgi:capsular exopolysaccharide synthesis family protein
VAEEDKIQLIEPALPSAERRRAELQKPYGYGPIDPDSTPDQLRSYWRILQKRIWTVAAIVVLSFTVVLIFTVKEIPVYRASGTLEIEQENPNIISVQSLFQLQNVSDDYLWTQYKILESDKLARQVIDSLHLDQVAEFNPPKQSWFSRSTVNAAPRVAPVEVPDANREQAVLRSFRSRLAIEPVRRSRLVQLTFDSQNPKLASEVVASMADNYIQDNLQKHWDATQKASEWLTQQLDGLKIKLEKSEDELQQYAQANNLLFLQDDRGQPENIIDERLRKLQDELTQAQADRYEKESLFHLVQAGDFGALPGVFDNSMMQDLTVKLADLEGQKAELSPNFNASYPKMKEIQSQIDRTQEFLKAQRDQAAHHIEDEYLASVKRESLVKQAFDEQQTQSNTIANKSVEYNILKREVETSKQLYEGLLQRLKEAGVSAGLKASNIRVVDPPVPPTVPVRPRVFLNVSMSLVVGLFFGIALAFVQERMDNTLKNSAEIEQFLGIPALAMIPSRQSLHHGKNRYVKALPNPSLVIDAGGETAPIQKRVRNDAAAFDVVFMQEPALSEAFRGLRTSVLLSTATRPPRSLAFVSSGPSEGKTTVCCSLAMSLSQLGKRVLVIDGDLRRPCVRNFFHLEDSAGLVNYLTGNDDWRSLLQPAGHPGLDCLVCGPVPPNPSELLSSERMQALITQAMGEYDFVLLDSPPLLDIADGRILITQVEGAILVVRAGETPREMMQRAAMQVSDVGAKLIGVVLNGVDLRHNQYYSSYSYFRGYGSDRPENHAA